MTRAIPLLLLVLSGCDLGGTICDQSVTPGLVVVVLDAATGEPAADGAVGIARDGAYVDTLRVFESRDGRATSLAGADERAGRYTVVVQKTGYAPWQQDGLTVREGECHVRQIRVTARLAPDTSP